MDNKGLLLVDFSAVSFAAAFAQGIENSLDEGFLRHLILNSILSARKKFKGYETVLAIDGRQYWRREIFPPYKAGRAKAREASDFDWTRFFKQRTEIINEIKQVFPYKVIEIPEAEADDIIGLLALESEVPTVIYAEDRDFHQCTRNPQVRLFSPRQGKYKEELTRFELEFELFEKICKGDGGDGIPNCLSPGNVMITEGVRQKPLSKKKISEWYEKGVPKDFIDRWEENQKLIDFRFIPEDIQARIREEYAKQPLGAKGKIFNYLTSKELMKISQMFLSDIESF